MKNKLFIQLALTFLIITIILGGIMAYVSLFSAQNYNDEVNQKLHANIAEYARDHVNTFNDDLSIDTNGIQMVMQSMMVINPNVEVYLLDTLGKIITYVAPYKKVVRTRVSLSPIKKFIEAKGDISIKGNDPRDPQGQKIFSAAEVTRDGKLLGYYYIILVSEERGSVLSSHTGSLAMRLGSRLILLAVIGSLILGLIAFWFQTKNLSKVIDAVEDFKEGNYTARVEPMAHNSGFSIIGETFNGMAQQIELNIEKIKSIDTFRKELIANISHDLRTPLAIIQGYTETLQLKMKDLKKKEKMKYLENINESTKRLNGLVNQLFELSKLENNQVKLNKEPFHIDELVQDMLNRHEVIAEKKGISFQFEKPEGLPLAHGDISLVERLIQNLMDNALKYTPNKGTVIIELDKGNEGIQFRITDNGKGIEEKNLSKIFERYSSGKKEETKTKGAGLGLAIAKKIVELHDSTINVQSKLNIGTSFSFMLPLYKANLG